MASILQIADVTSSVAASSARAWRGTSIAVASKQPEKLPELYDFEGCPFCRLFREVLTEIDLDVLVYPCPRGGSRFRPQAKMLGARSFPFLVDPNEDVKMGESAELIQYVWRTYGGTPPPAAILPRPLAVASSQAASALRRLRGVWARPSREPEQALELFSFESSPYSRVVREALCELELPYRLRSMGKAQTADMGPPSMRKRFYPDAPVRGRNRKELFAREGRLQVPYLSDPNTGTSLFESSDIVRYLNETYAV